jgi:hypothetical protein
MLSKLWVEPCQKNGIHELVQLRDLFTNKIELEKACILVAERPKWCIAASHREHGSLSLGYVIDDVMDFELRTERKSAGMSAVCISLPLRI